MNILIRPTEPDEFFKLGDIERSAVEVFRDHGMHDVANGSVVPPEFAISFARYGAALVAEVEGNLAGFACAASYDTHAHLYEISVARDFQGKGIGRKLVEAIVEWATRKGFRAITLSTFSDVPWNAPFYETLGFRKLGAHEWTPAFHMLRTHEENAGLDIERRCFMRKELSVHD